jgi:hypothetical protein
MKHTKHFTIIVLIGLAAIARGQNFKNDLGVEGGPGLTFLYGNHYANNNLKPFFGGTGGLYYQRNFIKIFALKTGLYYMYIGSKSPGRAYDPQGTPVAVTNVRLNTDYLSIPLLAKLSFGGPVKFFLNAGPYGAMMLHATQENQENYQNNTSDKTPSYKRFDAGVAFGLGLNVHISHFAFNLEERSNLGLVNTSSIAGNNGNGDVHTFISTLMIGFGYRFGEGKEKSK